MFLENCITDEQETPKHLWIRKIYLNWLYNLIIYTAHQAQISETVRFTVLFEELDTLIKLYKTLYFFTIINLF